MWMNLVLALLAFAILEYPFGGIIALVGAILAWVYTPQILAFVRYVLDYFGTR